MKIKTVWPLPVVLGLAFVACDPVDGDASTAAIPSDDDDQGTDGLGATSGPADPAATSGEAPPSGDDPPDDADTDDECAFLCPEDIPTSVFECDMFAQDCGEGEKCMPWADDGGSSWNATRCSPVDDNAGRPGDECEVEGSGVSGIDSCELGSMCWGVDPETNAGICVSMCSGDEANPVCDDPDTTCINVNGGAIVLCLPTCDALLQDCPDGEACYGINDSFTCIPDASGEMGLFGEPCEFINACDPGLFCAAAAAVPDCLGSEGCCSEFCDLEDEQGNEQCTGQPQGQECLPWSEDPLPGTEATGACVIPE